MQSEIHHAIEPVHLVAEACHGIGKIAVRRVLRGAEEVALLTELGSPDCPSATSPIG